MSGFDKNIKKTINEFYQMTLHVLDVMKVPDNKKREVAKGILNDFHNWIYFVVAKFTFEQINSFKNAEEQMAQGLYEAVSKNNGNIDIAVGGKNYRLVIETVMICMIRDRNPDTQWLANAGITPSTNKFNFNGIIDDFLIRHFSFGNTNRQDIDNTYSAILAQPTILKIIDEFRKAFQHYSSEKMAMAEQSSRSTGWAPYTNIGDCHYHSTMSTNAGWQPRVDMLVNFPSNTGGVSSAARVQSLTTRKYGLGKYVIFKGPPGTGKTRKAGRFIKDQLSEKIEKELVLPSGTLGGQWPEADRVRILTAFRKYECTTQFHQSYGYEDFIEGIRPFTDKKGQLSYKVCDGLFTATWRKATETFATVPVEWEVGTSFSLDQFFVNLYDLDAEEFIQVQTDAGHFQAKMESGLLTIDPSSWDKKDEVRLKALREIQVLGGSWSCDNDYFILIDEINRAKVSKVFGELLFVLGSSGENSLEVKTQYSKTPLVMVKNLHIVGTMNSCDKSVDHLDQALKRRFSFVEMMPFTASGDEASWKELNKELKDVCSIEVAKLLDAINATLLEYSDFEYDRQIGHSFFYKAATNFKRWAGENAKATSDKSDMALFCLFEVYFSNIFPVLQEFYVDDREGLEGLCPKEYLDTNNRSLALNSKIRDILSEMILDGRENAFTKWIPLKSAFASFLTKITGENVTEMEPGAEQASGDE